MHCVPEDIENIFIESGFFVITIIHLTNLTNASLKILENNARLMVKSLS